MQFMDRWFDGFGLCVFAQRVFDHSKLLYMIYLVVSYSIFGVAVTLLSFAAAQLHPNGQLIALIILSCVSMPVIVRHMVLFIRAYFGLLRLMFRSVASMFGWVTDTSDETSHRKAVQDQRLTD